MRMYGLFSYSKWLQKLQHIEVKQRIGAAFTHVCPSVLIQFGQVAQYRFRQVLIAE